MMRSGRTDVARALDVLESRGLARQDRAGGWTITDAGRAEARHTEEGGHEH
jgi:Mn-dependent DtxR family transcriptional regulator